jgi:hypothetical protein
MDQKTTFTDRDRIIARLVEIERQYPFWAWERDRSFRRQWILDHARVGGVGAEVGVFRGHFSERIAEVLRPKKFYLIDPWTLLGDRFGYGGVYTNENTLPTATAREDALLKAHLFPAPMEVVAIEAFFPACAARISERLDWVYLDASHKYEETLAELHGADSVIASDGIIFGDDWQPDRTHRHHGVFRAVNAFITSHNYEIVAAGPEGQWCIRRSELPDNQ